MKNTLDRFTNQLDSAEEKKNKLEDITIETSKMKHKEEY